MPCFHTIYIYIIYTPNLGFVIAIPGREREQGRFRGSSEGASREHGRAAREQRGAQQERRGSGSSVSLDLAAFCSAFWCYVGQVSTVAIPNTLWPDLIPQLPWAKLKLKRGHPKPQRPHFPLLFPPHPKTPLRKPLKAPTRSWEAEEWAVRVRWVNKNSAKSPQTEPTSILNSKQNY